MGLIMDNNLKDNVNNKDDFNSTVCDQYCDLIFSSKALEEDRTKKLEKILITMNDNGIHVPYEIIAKRIFDYKGRVDNLVNRAEQVLDTVANNKCSKLIESTIRNIELTKVQDDFIDEKTSKANDELQNIKEQSNKISKMKESIYTDFITILGIFTAITFAIFGGITSVSHAFEKIQNVSSIGGALISAGISFLLVYGIVIILFTGVSKITNLDTQYEFTHWLTVTLILFAIVSIIVGIILIRISE